jgi:lysophospholipase L1-like esterase
VPVPAPAPEAAPAALTSTYVALGDSFASGEGLRPFLPGTAIPGTNACHRSAKAYPALLATRPPFVETLQHHLNVACSGARIVNVLRGQWNEASQVDWLNAGNTLVTLTVGGNDVGFATVAFWCLVTSTCQRSWSGRVQRLTERVGRALPGVYRAIARAAPNARVVVVGYPRLFPRSPSQECAQQLGTFDAGEQRWFNAATARLNAAMRAAVSAVKIDRVRYVDTYDAFAGHELCGPGGAVNPVSLADYASSLHPSRYGQALLAYRVRRATRT